MITPCCSPNASFRPKTFLAVTALVLFTFHLRGADNAWTNATSGNWQDPHWSLGILPGAGQNIYFTNSGWKAVAIGAGTAQTNSQTLTVQDVVVSSPGTDTVNTLLFNYPGLLTPFQANSLSIGANCNLDMHYSTLNINNSLRVDGTATQDVGTIVTNGGLKLGVTGSGNYTLADGTLISASMQMGTNFPSTFTQTGGSNSAVNLRIYSSSVYTLSGGAFWGDVFARSGAKFAISGGHMVYSNATFGVDGSFEQTSGVIDKSGWMGAPDPLYLTHVPGSSGTISQTGGTNNTARLDVGVAGPPEDIGGPGPSETGMYTLSNGVLTAESEFLYGRGTFDQFAGSHTVSGVLTAQGTAYYFNGILNSIPRYANYLLAGGNLHAAALNLGVAARFMQSGGTNQIDGGITITAATTPVSTDQTDGRYTLAGGYLTAGSVTAVGGQLAQWGGFLTISGDLRISGRPFVQTGGTIIQSGVLALTNAAIVLSSGAQQFGQLFISSSLNTSNTIGMPPAPCVVHLSNSSAVAWDSTAKLSITNWSGSVYGGGSQRIIFGNNSSALTSAQLAQITFAQPTHLPSGNYPARILATGEIVPDTGSSLPLVVSISPSSNSTVQVGLGGQISNKYRIDISSDLLTWTPWQTQTDLSGMLYVSDTTAGVPQRFYRAMLAQ